MRSRGFFSLLILAAAVAAGVPAFAQEAAVISASAPDAGLKAGGIVARARVVSVDRDSRLVVLEAEDGERFDIVAGPEVRNLDQVKKGDPICVVEAMKLFNTIELSSDCTVVKFLVQHGDAVTKGQPLVGIET